jgi:archaemetzincin
MATVFVWWIGEAEEDRELMEHVRVELARAFASPVFLWRSPERPGHAQAYDARRKQWHTTPILRWLGEAGPGTGKVLGITDRDLFIPILTYVFGEAQLGGTAALLSTARLQEVAGGRTLLQDRVVKEAVHEVGHAFGLLHCHNEGCVMTRSPAVREVDGKRPELCADCRAQVASTREGA